MLHDGLVNFSYRGLECSMILDGLKPEIWHSKFINKTVDISGDMILGFLFLGSSLCLTFRYF